MEMFKYSKNVFVTSKSGSSRVAEFWALQNKIMEGVVNDVKEKYIRF